VLVPIDFNRIKMEETGYQHYSKYLLLCSIKERNSYSLEQLGDGYMTAELLFLDDLSL